MRNGLNIAMGALLGAVIAAMVGYAGALITGTPPNYAGPQMIDGQWLIGLAQGNNFTYQSGISAAGSTAATGTAINPNIALVEVDTVGSSQGVVLPFAIAPDFLLIRNAGAQTLTIYSNPGTNLQTNTTDTVNGGTSVSVLQNKSALCFAAKNGAYSCILSS